MSLSLSLSMESSFSGPPTDSSSLLASSSSTPPTTVADSASLHSDASKHDVITVADDAVFVASEPDPPAPAREHAEENQQIQAPAGRAKRARAAPVYNISQLSGTASHGKRRANGDVVVDRMRRRTTGDDGASPRADKSARHGIDALDLRWSPRSSASPRTRRQIRESPRSQRASARQPGTKLVSSLGTKLSALGKRKSKAAAKSPARMTREMRRLQDTKEFAHIDEAPVVYTVWANGKYIDPSTPRSPPRKRVKLEVPEEESEKEDAEPITNTRKRRVKKYLGKGLYSGQEMPADITKGITAAEKKKLAQLPELAPSGRVNKTMPLPIYTGFRMLIAGRDFKLPYQVCNPLPPGQPKPDEWKKMTKNRFIGDSKDYWRKTPHFHDFSTCVCKPEDGCGESCQNRIMLYECDETNCNAGKAHCTNRAFADLQVRRSKGGKYRVGVEVIKTSDRGYGVRSNRCFKPNQIIMEYAGEIITEEECDRRMNEVYKENECYYLMSFDQNMIIDATTGSIARFVNHSCNPNCRMIKWIVSGQPRMALFAGDRPITTGDELTYDYNFDPFSAKNVQKCLCAEPNCRGVLGPKKSEVKPPKADLKKMVKKTVKAGKRKLKELLGDDGDDAGGKKSNKKRKIQPAKGVKRSLSTASLKAAKGAKGAAKAVKKSVSTITVSAKSKTASSGAKSPAAAKRRASTGALLKKTTTKRVITTYARRHSSSSSTSTPTKKKKTKVMARKSTLTIVAAMGGGGGDKTPQSAKTSPRKRTPTKKAVAAAEMVIAQATQKSVG